MASHPQWYNPFRLPWYPLMGFSSIQLAILSIESMCNEAELETLCLGASRPLQNTSLVMRSRGSGWPGALSNIQRTLKGSFFIGKIHPDFRNKASIEPIQKKPHCPGLLGLQPKAWQLLFIFSLLDPGVSSFRAEGNHDH